MEIYPIIWIASHMIKTKIQLIAQALFSFGSFCSRGYFWWKFSLASLSALIPALLLFWMGFCRTLDKSVCQMHKGALKYAAIHFRSTPKCKIWSKYHGNQNTAWVCSQIFNSANIAFRFALVGRGVRSVSSACGSSKQEPGFQCSSV